MEVVPINTHEEAEAERDKLRDFKSRLASLFAANAATISREALVRSLTPSRDINFECGYPDKISFKNYKDMYEREGIATRCVKVFPEESWTQPPEVYEKEEGKDTPWEEAVKQFDRDNQINSYLLRVDTLSGIGRYGVLLIGVDDGQPLDKPIAGINLKTGAIEGTKQKRKLTYLRAFDEEGAKILSLNNDVTSPRFGFPEMYELQFGNTSDEATGATMGIVQKNVKVHWTRILHVADNRESSEVFGTPRMKITYNRLYDLRKVLAGSAEMFWKGGFPGFAFEINPDIADPELDVDSLKEQFYKYSNSLQRYFAVEGVTAKSLAPQVADPEGHVKTHVQAIAMSYGVPYRVFVGSEEAKLASTEDKGSWNERLRKRQNQYLTPMVVRPFYDRLMAIGVLEYKENYIVEWPDLDAPSDQDKATVAKSVAEALASYSNSAADDLVPPDSFLRLVMKFSQEEVEAISADRDKYIGEKEMEREEELSERETKLGMREKSVIKKEVKDESGMET